MAQPRNYTRQFNFNDFQTTSPATPLPGTQVDAELNTVKLTLDDLNTNIAKIQQDDGKIKNQAVHKDSFDAGALALMKTGSYSIQGDWTTSRTYAVGDLVDNNGATYVATSAHTSSSAFETDLTANKWILIANAGIANTASTVDKFEGTGSQTAFTLSSSYTSNTDVMVFVNGALKNPGDDFSISTNTITFVTAPSTPAVSGNENVIVFGSSVVAQAAKEAAQLAQTNASGFANEADNWARLTTGLVESTDYSSKAYAIGGTGVDAGSGSAKDWATKTSGTVGNTSEYSAKYWATQGNVPIVATNIASINTLAGINSEVSTVAGISTAVSNVSSISSDVTGVNAIASDVTGVNAIASDVTAVNNNSTNINNLATSANITAMGNLGTTTNVTNMANLNASGVIANMANLNASGVIANVNTVASNVSGVNSFAERYRVASSEPTSSLDEGDLYYDTTANQLKVYRSTGWIAASSFGNLSSDSTPELGGNLDVLTHSIVSSSDRNISITPNGAGVVRLDGNVDISTGAIDLKNGGTQSYIRFYCESSNAHYAQLQAPSHSAFSGNITLTMPATTGTIALTSQIPTVPTSGIANGNVATFTSGVADDDFLRVNGTSIEGRSASEVVSDIGAATTGDATALAIALG